MKLHSTFAAVYVLLLLWIETTSTAWAFLQPSQKKIPSSCLSLFKAKRQRLRSLFVPRNSRHERITKNENTTAATSGRPNHQDVAAQLNVRPLTEAPNWVWKFAWRGHGRMLPLLHWRDAAVPRDSAQSLKVVWNKALVSIDRKSPGYDSGWVYDSLPRRSRWVLKVFRPLFPRLHHANIEIRTVYLNRVIQQEIDHARARQQRVRLITLGGGYDTRGVRLLSTVSDNEATEGTTTDKVTMMTSGVFLDNNTSQITENLVDEVWELDLPDVLDSKRAMLERLQKQRQRRRNGTPVLLPQLCPIDLNNLTDVEHLLGRILSQNDANETEWYTIFISEGVLIYLDDPTALLQCCAKSIRDSNNQNASSSSSTTTTASLCFADRLANVPSHARADGLLELERAGNWSLLDWTPKPGLARHMGIARLCNHERIE